MINLKEALPKLWSGRQAENHSAPLTVFGGLTERDKASAVERLVIESTPRGDFFVLIILAILMATLGLFSNSVEVVIGSMLIAPLLYPILSLAMGVVMADSKLILRSIFTMIKAVVIAIPAAALAALFLYARHGGVSDLTMEMASRIYPSLTAAGIALIARAAASLALVKTHLGAALPGVAVSVALLPPLAVTGIGLARWDWSIMAQSFILFSINAACIVFSGVVVFSLSRLYTKQKVASKTVKSEDEKLDKGET